MFCCSASPHGIVLGMSIETDLLKMQQPDFEMVAPFAPRFAAQPHFK
jgi:hypothetical protein